MEVIAERASALVDVPLSLMRPDLARREPEPGSRFESIAGRSFDAPNGPIYVIGLAGWLKKYSTWLCRCYCGNLFLSRVNTVRHRPTGCGCMHTEHGLSGTYWSSIHSGMMSRCYNPNSKAFNHYGGRGIKVCRRWRESVANFAEDMGERPSPSHSIDRINNDGDYKKSNCRWATPQEKCRNRRGVYFITYGGETLIASDWARKCGLSRERIRQRVEKCIELNADISEAVSTPAGEMMPCVIEEIRLRREGKRAISTSLKELNDQQEALEIANIMALMNGDVHHLTASQAHALCGNGFDYTVRKFSHEAGKKPCIRRLGDHILFQAK